MVQADIDNDVVFVYLTPGQSVTVPSNETWRVEIENRSSTNYQIDGNKLGKEFKPIILQGGQTFEFQSGDQYGTSFLFLTGFVVNN